MTRDPRMTQQDATTAAAVLRVLKGPQKGARLVLQSRQYLFGSGDDCDVILADEGIAAEHAEIAVDVAQIKLTARDGEVLLQDRVVAPGETAEIMPPCTLLFGGTVVGIGAGDTDWNAVPVPDRAAIEAAAAREAEEAAERAAAESAEAAAPEAEAEGEAGEAAEPKPGAESEDAEKPAEPEPAAEEQQTASEDAEAQVEHPRRRTGLLVAASVLAIALAGAGAYVAFGGKGAETDGEAAVEASAQPAMTQSEVAELVKVLGFTDVIVSAGANGEVVLWGHVADGDAHVALIEALREHNVVFEDDTRRVDHLMSSVNMALSSFSWPVSGFRDHLEVSYVGSGSIEIDGFLGPQVDRETLSRLIKSDAPGLNIVRFKRATLADWRAILVAKIADAGLDKWLETDVNAGRIRISGELTPIEAKSWRAVGEAFVAESRGWPELEIAVRLTADTPPPPTEDVEPIEEVVVAPPAEVIEAPDIRLIGVILGSENAARALLSDGESVSVGDVTEDGAEVIKIMQHSMVLRFKGKEFTYHMRDDQ